MFPDLMGCIIAALIALGIAWALGLGDDEDTPCKPPSRYVSKSVDTECYGMDVQVVTDMQTGRRWLVAESHSGGVAIEPMNGGVTSDVWIHDVPGRRTSADGTPSND